MVIIGESCHPTIHLNLFEDVFWQHNGKKANLSKMHNIWLDEYVGHDHW